MKKDLYEEFRECMGTVSFARAGWDYYNMPLSQKKGEASAASVALARVREIWKDNPELHQQLEAVFSDYAPLMTLDEIKRA